MTKLNVHAAGTITGEFHCGSVCVDCLMLLANGECENPDPTWNQEITTKVLGMYEVTLGHFHDSNEFDNRCHHKGTECEDDCECEKNHFADSACSLCDTRLGGSRDDVTIWSRELLDTTMTQEQFDKLNSLCDRYKVKMNVGDYVVYSQDSALSSKGWTEGWVGGLRHGPSGDLKRTIYIAVDPEGNSHS